MSKEPRLEISTEKIIVIDNIPKVGVDKKDKLKKVLSNILCNPNIGKVTNEYYPEDESGTLKGLVSFGFGLVFFFFFEVKFFKIFNF